MSPGLRTSGGVSDLIEARLDNDLTCKVWIEGDNLNRTGANNPVTTLVRLCLRLASIASPSIAAVRVVCVLILDFIHFKHLIPNHS
jgi:hypothetical protein